MGPTSEYVGTWLANHPEAYGGDRAAMLSIAFTGAKGTRRTEAWTPGTWTFDVTDLGRSIYTVRPRRQFDAFVVYPEVSVLESLSLLHL